MKRAKRTLPHGAIKVLLPAALQEAITQRARREKRSVDAIAHRALKKELGNARPPSGPENLKGKS